MIFVADWMTQICEASHIFMSLWLPFSPAVGPCSNTTSLKRPTLMILITLATSPACGLTPHPALQSPFLALLPFPLHLPLSDRLYDRFCYLLCLFIFCLSLVNVLKCEPHRTGIAQCCFVHFYIQSTQNSTWHIAGIW